MAFAPSDEFTRPVVILTGLGCPTAVTSAMEAYMFLADWPMARRDAAHSFACKACLSAVRGEIEVETAKGLFSSWAERQGILATEVAAFAAHTRAGFHGSA